MKCFYHHDQDAVGLCKSCGRGLCPECAVELEKGLACRGRCEEDALKLARLIDRNIALAPAVDKRIRAGKRTGLISAGFFIVIGIVFMVQTYASRGRHLPYMYAFGAVFVIYGLINLFRVLRLAGAPPNPS